MPDRRIVWTSDGKKGSTKGVVTFHPLADDLTRILLDIEYYPTGLVEKTGNIWRAVGRRARLDLKHFRRFVTMEGEATGSWRGEIRDGEVVSRPDEQDDKAGQRSGDAAKGADRSRGSQDSDAGARKQSKASKQQDKGEHEAEDGNEEEASAEESKKTKAGSGRQDSQQQEQEGRSKQQSDSSDDGGSGSGQRREASADR